jgi:hypothetical protein
MKSLLLRLWQWLGRLLGQDTKYEIQDTKGSDELPAAAPPSTLATPVTLPAPPPPQMDLHTGEPPVFSRWGSILTKPEKMTYKSLLSAVRNDYQVMCKVRLWDIVRLENDPPERKQHLSRLSCRHVDFLLCEPNKLKPLLVIELDDSSHQTPYAQESDRYKNELFAAVGLPLLRLPHPNLPPHVLRRQIDEKLN